MAMVAVAGTMIADGMVIVAGAATAAGMAIAAGAATAAGTGHIGAAPIMAGATRVAGPNGAGITACASAVEIAASGRCLHHRPVRPVPAPARPHAFEYFGTNPNR